MTVSHELAQVGRAIAYAESRYPDVVRTLPIQLGSRLNGSQGISRGWRHSVASRTRTHRAAARLAVIPAMALLGPGEHIVARLVRVAPRELDSDNLAAALKAVRDGVADALGLASDRDPRVVWLPDQERGEPRQALVRIELYWR